MGVGQIAVAGDVWVAAVAWVTSEVRVAWYAAEVEVADGTEASKARFDRQGLLVFRDRARD